MKKWDVEDIALLILVSVFPLGIIAGIVAAWRCS
jgi:hypothetical protein